MNKSTAEQRLFLEHMAAGKSVMDAAAAIGRSRSTAYGWARRNPVFAAQFASVNPKFQAYLSNTQVDTVSAVPPAAIVAQKTPAGLTLHQLAMQRLERELRANGPNAVLAAAAIVLTSPQAAPVDSPAVEADTVSDDAPESLGLQVTNLSVDDLIQMFHEVYPIGELPAIPADTTKIKKCIEQYFDCELETALQLSRRSIANILSRMAAKSFPVVFETQGPSHMPKIYMVPHPKTRA